MRAVSGRIAGSGASIDEAVAVLDADPGPGGSSQEASATGCSSSPIARHRAQRTHFDIPEQVCGGVLHRPDQRRRDLLHRPSEDFSRPGRMWWAVPDGDTEFST